MAFSDRPRLYSIWPIVALYSFLAPAVCRPFGASDEIAGLLHVIGWQLPRYCEYLIILHGMWTIIASWSDDLIESRGTLRRVMLGVVGLGAIGVTLSVNNGMGSTQSLIMIIRVAVLVCAHFLLKGRGKGFLFYTVTRTTGSTINNALDASVQAVEHSDIQHESQVLAERTMTKEGEVHIDFCSEIRVGANYIDD